jgi:hypothetical protein
MAAPAAEPADTRQKATANFAIFGIGAVIGPPQRAWFEVSRFFDGGPWRSQALGQGGVAGLPAQRGRNHHSELGKKPRQRRRSSLLRSRKRCGGAGWTRRVATRFASACAASTFQSDHRGWLEKSSEWPRGQASMTRFPICAEADRPAREANTRALKQKQIWVRIRTQIEWRSFPRPHGSGGAL